MPGARRQSPRRKRSLSTMQKASAKRARRDGRPRSQPASPVKPGKPVSQPTTPVKKPAKPVSLPATPVKQPAKPLSPAATPQKDATAESSQQVGQTSTPPQTVRQPASPTKPLSRPSSPDATAESSQQVGETSTPPQTVRQPASPTKPLSRPSSPDATAESSQQVGETSTPPQTVRQPASPTKPLSRPSSPDATAESSQQVGETSTPPQTVRQPASPTKPLSRPSSPHPKSPQHAVEALSLHSGFDAPIEDIQSATPNATSSPTRDVPSGHDATAKSTGSTPKFTPSKSSTVGSRKIKADLLLARKDDLQELLVSETIPHTNTESSDTDVNPTEISLDASAQDADAENTDSTVPLDLSVDTGGSLVGKEPPNIPVDLTKKKDNNKLVTESNGEAYLHLTIPSIELGSGVVIGSVTPDSNLGELKTKQLRSEAKRIRRELDKTSERFRDAHNECTRLRDAYYYNALKHAEISHHIHIREALKVTGTLNRPLSEQEKLLVDSMNLRSGTKLKLKKNRNRRRVAGQIVQF